MHVRPYLPDTLSALATIHDTSRIWWERLEHLSVAGDDEFIAGFFTLLATLEHDFRAEEVLMEKNDYPALYSHREQHARMLLGLHRADPCLLQKNQLSSARKAVLLLQQQLQVHRATMDFPFVMRLREMASMSTTRAAKPESQFRLPKARGGLRMTMRDSKATGFRGR